MYRLVFKWPFDLTLQTEGGVLSDTIKADALGFQAMMRNIYNYDVISLHMIGIDHSGHSSKTDVNDNLYDEAVPWVEK